MARGRSCPEWSEWPWTDLSWLEGVAVDGSVLVGGASGRCCPGWRGGWTVLSRVDSVAVDGSVLAGGNGRGRICPKWMEHADVQYLFVPRK